MDLGHNVRLNSYRRESKGVANDINAGSVLWQCDSELTVICYVLIKKHNSIG